MTHEQMRWTVAIASFLVAGMMKGISGMGLPLVATPILAALYDLPTAIAITVPATVLSDLPLLYIFRGEWRQSRRLVPLLIPAMLGIVVGTQLLVRLSPNLLRAVLGGLVLLFVSFSYFRLFPGLSDQLTARFGPAIGLGAGILQGAAGQSGPLISVCMYQLNLSREAFLFVINAFFLVADSTLLISLVWNGLYSPARWLQAAAAAVFSLPTIMLGLRLQRRFSEERFRRVVLAILTLTGVVLVVRELF